MSDLWTGSGAKGWVAAQTLTDLAFKPVEAMLTDAAAGGSPQSVLDVGCGTGATTVAVARRLGSSARCLGIDVSEMMIDAARARAAREAVAATFECANAETHPFEPASVDLILSRFGVMFFADSARAFSNLRRAAARGARLRCVVWRGIEENAFITTAERAAEPLLPGVSTRHPDEPGPFRFADRGDTIRLLERSGWQKAELVRLDVPCALPASGLELYASSLGPVGRALQTADGTTRRRVLDVVVPAFDTYRHGGEVRFTAACWMMSAEA